MDNLNGSVLSANTSYWWFQYRLHLYYFGMLGIILVYFSLFDRTTGTPIDNGVVGTPAITCGDGYMTLKVTTQNPFFGRLFVKGESSDPKCANAYQTLHATAPEITVSLGSCNVRRLRVPGSGLEYTAVIIVSFHPTFITKVDKAYRVHCEFKSVNETVTPNSPLLVSMIPTTEVITQSAAEIQCTYEIRKGAFDGPPARYVIVGEPVFHVWQCQTNAMRILVRDCFADDGQGNKVTTIDDQGCSVDRYVVATPNYLQPHYTLSFTEAHVFKYADKPQVLFQCQIELCDSSDAECQASTPPTNCAIPPLPAGSAVVAEQAERADQTGFHNASETIAAGAGGIHTTARHLLLTTAGPYSVLLSNKTTEQFDAFKQVNVTNVPAAFNATLAPLFNSTEAQPYGGGIGNFSAPEVASPVFLSSDNETKTNNATAFQANVVSSSRTPLPPLVGKQTLPTPARFRFRHRLKHDAGLSRSTFTPEYISDVVSNELVVFDLNDENRQLLENARLKQQSSLDAEKHLQILSGTAHAEITPAFCIPLSIVAVLSCIMVILFVASATVAWQLFQRRRKSSQ